jgi:dethiobiotin synthetase
MSGPSQTPHPPRARPAPSHREPGQGRARARAVFVTGTDTGVGKTRVAAALLRALAAAGWRAVGMKPVAAGFEPGSAINADVAELQRAGSVDAPAADRNPYAFAAAVAPHLAASAAGRPIELARIVAAFERLRARADAVVVEGAGGVLVPLDARTDMLDVAAALRLPVLLVVGMRLGCLNHALLSALAIERRGLVLCGWVANHLPPPMALARANVDALTMRLGVPPLASVGTNAMPAFGGDALSALGFAPGSACEPC